MAKGVRGMVIAWLVGVFWGGGWGGEVGLFVGFNFEDIGWQISVSVFAWKKGDGAVMVESRRG
jgi:Na+/citrate or Na+/malate symporter